MSKYLLAYHSPPLSEIHWHPNADGYGAYEFILLVYCFIVYRQEWLD